MGILKEERIGGQRLILGDAMDALGDVGGYHSLVTDPPYGMKFQSNRRAVKHKKIVNDDGLNCLDWALGLTPDHSSYIWMRWDNLSCIPKPKSVITWVKNNHGMGDLKHEHGRKTEICAFYPGPKHRWSGKRPNDVLMASKTGNKLHPTQKPISLMVEVVGWTKGIVFDPFMGSGATLVACETMGRIGVGIEIDPDYFDIACEQVHLEFCK